MCALQAWELHVHDGKIMKIKKQHNTLSQVKPLVAHQQRHAVALINKTNKQTVQMGGGIG